MMSQTIFFFFKHVNYLYQHNNSTHAAFREKWAAAEYQIEKKGKKEKQKQKHSYCKNNHAHVMHEIDKGILYIGYMIRSLE
jgi:hypothetical protein